ncbi:NmrA/HSCARG family protein [soil metagenome]
MRGAYGAYCVTFFWEYMSPEKEIAHIKNLAEAAKAEDLKHVVWSTLEDTRSSIPLDDDRMPTLGGSYKVPHFDAKGSSDHFFADAGVPTTYLLTSFYWDNFIYFGMGPKKGEDGKYSITSPIGDSRLPGMAAQDIGRCADGIFKEGPALAGKRIGIMGEALTGEQMAEVFSRKLDKEITFNAVSPEVYRGFGFPGADDLGNMFQYNSEFEKEFTGARDKAYAKELNPALQDFETWVSNNKEKIPME